MKLNIAACAFIVGALSVFAAGQPASAHGVPDRGCGDEITTFFCDAKPEDPEGTQIKTTITCTSGNTTTFMQSQVGACVPENNGPEEITSMGNCVCQ
jgi:hypothetical protein